MKQITVIFEASDGSSAPPSVLPRDRLEAAEKLLLSLCEAPDFARRFVEFLKSNDSEVPTVSWQLPPDT